MSIDLSKFPYPTMTVPKGNKPSKPSAVRSRFRIGDHLIVSRSVYSHHGIYVGGGGVIHYSGLSNGFSAGTIVHDYLESFAPDGKITVREYPSAQFKGKAVVERAESRLGENRYDVHSNNCEDFCSWAVTGASRSGQVDFVEDLLEIVSPAAAAAARLRKHASREKAGGAVSDLAASAFTVAIAAAAPALIPLIVARKLIRGIIK